MRPLLHHPPFTLLLVVIILCLPAFAQLPTEPSLDEIKADGAQQVLNARTSLTPLRKLWLAWLTWLRT